MRARRVKLDPEAPFGEAVATVASVRLAELDSFAAAAADPREVTALHDMRIAAKRMRYVLEIAAPVVPDAGRRAKAAKRLQEVLGDIHDCDELLPMLDAHLERLRGEDADAAGRDEPLPNRRRYRGLEALRAGTVARRWQLHARFVQTWPKLREALAAGQRVRA